MTAITYRFDRAFRDLVIRELATFVREPSGVATISLKRAAVTIALSSEPESGRAVFFLTRRAADLRSHAGQWALPGGRCDEGETAIEGALRELEEELGLKVPAADVLGLLDDYPTRSGYLITPVVVWVRNEESLAPNPAEVESVFRIPVDQLAEPDAVDFVYIPQSHRPVIRLRMNDDHIHAPTAAILYQFREILAGRHTRVSAFDQPVFAWR